MRICLACAAAALLLTRPALADPAASRAAAAADIKALGTNAAGPGASGIAATISLEEHETNNALDSDLQFADFYSVLRGTISYTFKMDNGYFRLATGGQITKYDHIAIEDDASLALMAEAYRHLTDRLELRGTLTWRTASVGDDLRIGNLALGTRTPGNILAAGIQLGADLGSNYALILGASDTLELYGKSAFQDGLIPDARLKPDRNRVALSAAISKTLNGGTVGVSAAADLAAVDRLGDPAVGLSYDQYAAGASAAFTVAGAKISATFGAGLLRGAQGVFQTLRPIYKFAFDKAFVSGWKLKGSLAAAFETVDTDDPLASYLRRLELELSLPPIREVVLGAGIFHQRKENLVLDDVERSNGVYVELAYAMTTKSSIVLRIDYSRCHETGIDIHKDTADAFLALRTKL